MAELWQKLRSRRRELDITQQQVADFCSVSKGSVAQWEAKKPENRAAPRRDKLARLAEILEVPINWFHDESVELSSVSKVISDIEEDEYQVSKKEADAEERSVQVILELNNLSLMGKLTKEDIQILEALVRNAQLR
ncbi:helix-turn-helix transcriptional regulator [Endozoicomonas sp. SM1973]|uniref:Helix-turn-helix transcriptional regulator n=1 Tax=Spartinivicinus marinus TaxID=2994442 RepID=A0A853IJF0_9GAMM|nr:helix-turn-helix transcriptional regulator [Spartinivicinus marinus]MCX4026984.1 helix-turn-helix transcriptional regulator [Spartinivicinus marinus]NYZ70221.1 helix-turn-helix transcriptional regulator [Spartinivicinus marinus]